MSGSLLRALLDRSPSPVCAAEAVRDPATGTFLDLRILYGNRCFRDLVARVRPSADTGSLRAILAGPDPTPLTRLFGVMETGTPFRGIQEWDGAEGRVRFEIWAEKVENTLILSLTELGPTQDLTDALALLTGVLDASQSMVTYCQAVRGPSGTDGRGPIIDFQYRFANENVARLIGAPLAEILNNRMTRFFPSVKEIGLFDLYVQVVESGNPQSFEFPYRQDGYDGWYLIQAQPLGDGFVLSFIDITRRKRTELELQQANSILNAVLNATAVAVTAFRAVREAGGRISDFDCVSANERASQILNRPVDELTRFSLLTLYPALRERGDFDQFVEVVETGRTLRYETLYQADGLDAWFDVTVTRQDDGFVLTYLDISDRKKAELAIGRHAQQLQAMLDASISSILVMTAIRGPGNGTETGPIIDFRMDLANRSVERSLGKTPAELEGRTLLEVFPGNVENGFFDLYAKAADTGISQQATLHYTDINGFEGWFEISAVQMAKDQIVLTFMNVTQTKQTEQQLRESNASLDQFATVASHDLQEPLRKIKSFGDLLAAQYGPVLGDGVMLLERMQSASSRMQTLIRDLLAYSRLSTQRPLAFQPVDLNRVVAEVLVDLDLAVSEKGATVEVGRLPTLQGEPLQIRQAFQNLLSNALKFSEPGRPPVITVKSRLVRRADLPAAVKLYGTKYWEVQVADNGIGFEEAYRERIFGAFERLHGKNSRYLGSGIGLAIVRRVMDNHQGAVSAQGEVGIGSAFSLFFPVHLS
ncbi:PAS domain-containing protein [Larkinella soli]|uniref:PAS domain-containing protein n=1 Tax=Larkinella soli TaxID=1770527 RepID=UPI0013E290DE|nr:PAS domain-containing protein [Larkinella soli]